MGFSKQEYRSGLPLSSPGDLHEPGMEHKSSVMPPAVPPASQANSLSQSHWESRMSTCISSFLDFFPV